MSPAALAFPAMYKEDNDIEDSQASKVPGHDDDSSSLSDMERMQLPSARVCATRRKRVTPRLVLPLKSPGEDEMLEVEEDVYAEDEDNFTSHIRSSADLFHDSSSDGEDSDGTLTLPPPPNSADMEAAEDDEEIPYLTAHDVD